MKKTFLTAVALVIMSSSALAECPSFKVQYEECRSRSRISAFQISEVSVRERIPYYRFLIKTPSGFRHLKFVADGEPEEITIQTNEGIELTYTQNAYCSKNKVHLDVISEENFGKESYEFSANNGDLKIKMFLNNIMINEANCKESLTL